MLVTLLSLSSAAWSDTTPQYRFFPVGNDLDSPYVKDIEIDGPGFVWLATSGGLYRYDGLELTPMGPEPEGEPVGVHRIAFDKKGGLWAMTEQHFYYRDSGSLRWGEPIAQPPQERGQGIFDFAVADDGALWLASWGLGMVRMDPAAGSVSYVDAPHPRPEIPDILHFRCLLIDRAGRVWAGSDFGLHLYDPSANEFQLLRIPVPSRGPNAEITDELAVINRIAEAGDGTLLIATDLGPLRFEPASQQFEHFPGWAKRFPPGARGKLLQRVISIAEGPSGRIWMGIDGRGLDVFDPETHRWLNIPARPDDVFGLIDEFVVDIYPGGDGLLWFGTRAGANRLDPRSGRFHAWPYHPDGSYGPNTVPARQVIEDSGGQLWVASDAGLEHLDPETGEWTVYRRYPEGNPGTNSNWTHGLAEDSGGRFWVATSGLINLFDRTAYSFTSRAETYPFIFMHDDGAGNLLVAYDFSDGIALFNPADGVIRRLDGTEVRVDEGPEIPLATSFQAYSAFEDSAGRHWLATSEGLKRWHPESRRLTDVVLPAGDYPAVAKVIEADDGLLWLATAEGLKLFDPESLSLVNRTDVQLPTEPINDMVADGLRRLWLATPDGLVLFDPQSGRRYLYRREDGLPGNRIGPRRMVTRKNGDIVVATDRGLVTLDPDEFPQTRQAPAVAIAAIEVDDRAMLTGGKGATDPLVLDHHDILLSIDFAALDLSQPELNHYRYRMAGLDKAWRDATPDRSFATYTTLPPGDYHFEVTAANSDGVWNEAGLSLPIQVLPPPWRTGWAYTIYVVALLLAVALLVAFRTRQLRQRSVELETEVAARTREIEHQRQTIAGQASRLEKLLATKNRLFADISHEFRTPLTLISGPVDEAAERVEDTDLAEKLEMAKQSVSRLTRLVDQLLDLARLDAGQVVSRTPQPLSAILASQIRAFRPLAEARGVKLSEGEIENRWVACGSDALEKILANLLSNAIKFTPNGGHIVVSVQAVGNHVCLEVADTGVGIPVDMQAAVFERFNRGVIRGEQVSGAGIGLALVRELAQSCDGHVEMDSDEGAGTTVRIFLPETAPPAAVLEPTLQPGDALRQEVEVLDQTGQLSRIDSRASETEQVLIIEDNADLRRYLPSVLGKEFNYATSVDGETGLETALESIPDLVICDAMLPGVDGFSVCNQIKTDPRTSHVPVLMLTARADDASRLKGYEHHADDYLTKPFSGEELRVRVRNLLEARRIMRQRFSRQLFTGNGLVLDVADPDSEFLAKLETRVEQNYQDPDFSASGLASVMAMSLRQLQRKMKAIVDHSPAEYIRNYRLMMAKKRIEAGESASRACFSVGFTSQSYFSRCFKAYFGMSPSEVRPSSPDASD